MNDVERIHQRIKTTVSFGITTRLGRVPYVVEIEIVLRYPPFHYGPGFVEAFDVVLVGDSGEPDRHANQHTRRMGFVAKREAGWVAKPSSINAPELYFGPAAEAAVALATEWLRKLATETWEVVEWQQRRARGLATRKAS